MKNDCQGKGPHDAHLTGLARLALRMPGQWAWGAVLRARLATRRCRKVVE